MKYLIYLDAELVRCCSGPRASARTSSNSLPLRLLPLPGPCSPSISAAIVIPDQNQHQTKLESMRSVRDLFLVFGAGHMMTLCSPNTRVPRFVQPHARSAHHNSARVGTRVQSTLISRA